MPNHCYQRVRVSGDKEIIAALHNHLCNEGRFLDAIIPTPLEMWGHPMLIVFMVSAILGTTGV